MPVKWGDVEISDEDQFVDILSELMIREGAKSPRVEELLQAVKTEQPDWATVGRASQELRLAYEQDRLPERVSSPSTRTPLTTTSPPSTRIPLTTTSPPNSVPPRGLLIAGILCVIGLIGLVGYDRLSPHPTASLTKDELTTELAKHNTHAGLTKDELTTELAKYGNSAELAKQLAVAQTNNERQFKDITIELAVLNRLTQLNMWSPADRGPRTVQAVYGGTGGFGPLLLAGNHDLPQTVAIKTQRLAPEQSRAISGILKSELPASPAQVLFTWQAEVGLWEVATAEKLSPPAAYAMPAPAAMPPPPSAKSPN